MNVNLPSKRTLAQQSKAEAAAAAYGRDPYEGLRRMAMLQCARTGSVSSHPQDCSELAAAIDDTRRARLYGPVTNRQRDMVAKGMPYQDITRRDGSSVVQDGLYCLNSKAA